MASFAPMQVCEESKSDQRGDVNTAEVENTLNEYETQLFGFTPVTLVNGMYNTVCDFYRDALKEFCASLKANYPGVMTDEELNTARYAVSQKIDKDVCQVFDKLELFAIRNVFTIPDECVLPEDDCQLTYDSTKGDEVNEKIVESKKNIMAVKYANAKLMKELDESSAFRDMLDKVVESLNDWKQGENQDINMKDVLSYFSDTITTAFNKNKS